MSGEFTDKYTKSGRIGRLLVDRFFSAVGSLIAMADLPPAASVLEAGCGAGYSTERLARFLPPGARIVASEIDVALARQARARNATVPVASASIYAAPHPSRSFDLVLLLEVLEHLENPRQALAELHRLTRGQVIVSTPREPLWRLMNMARGKYWRDLGNTPGHVQHWSSTGLARLVSPWFEVEARRTPLPWTMLLLTPKRL